MSDSTLQSFHCYGTNAQRLAFTPSVPTSTGLGGGVVYIWYETDTTLTYAYHGSWSQVGGGAMTLITETTTTSSATNVTFSSISAAYRDLVIRVRGRSQVASAVDSVVLQFNGDTGANYDYIFWQAFGSTVSAASTFAATSLSVGQVAAASGTANRAGAVEVKIFDYRGTTFDKEFISQSGAASGTSGNGLAAITNSGTWRSTAAINAVKVFLGTGPFVDGSIVSLYGSL